MDPNKNLPGGGRLTATKILNLVKDRGMTLEEIAENQGMDYDEFITLAKKLVGQKKFPELQQRSDANGKRKKKLDKKEEKATNIGFGEQKGIPASGNQLTEAERLEELRRALETIQTYKKKAEGNLKAAQKKRGQYAGKTAAAHAECERIRRMLERAEADVLRLQGLQNEAGEDENDAQADIAYWHMEVSKVEGRIYELENSTIYLVHPQYSRALPKKGTFVSCAEVQHPNYKADIGEDLVEEPGWSTLKNMGYKNFDEVEADIEFAKLVVKYLITAEDGRKCYILVEDQRMVAMLNLQGIEVSDYQP